MQLVSGINTSGIYAQYASSAVNDANGNNIVNTYAKKTDVTGKQDALTNAQLSAISSVSSISSTVDGKQDTLTFGYNESNAISSINSSAIAGGSTFTGCTVNEPITGDGTDTSPLGLDALQLTGANGITVTATDDSIVVSADNTIMNTSKLEYDGDKISGYDGSAFAGGGSGGSYEGVSPIVVDNTENKISADTVDVTYQQITHDDSLVHVSNSAQYALGVNMSAMPGYETVLWSGDMHDRTVSATLSADNFKNYESLKFYCYANNQPGQRAPVVHEISLNDTSAAGTYYAYLPVFNISANSCTGEILYVYGEGDGKTIYLINGIRSINFSAATTGISSYNASIRKITGIGRKS